MKKMGVPKSSDKQTNSAIGNIMTRCSTRNTSILLFVFSVLTFQLTVYTKPSLFLNIRSPDDNLSTSHRVSRRTLTTTTASINSSIRGDSSDNNKGGKDNGPINPHDKICRDYLLKFIKINRSQG